MNLKYEAQPADAKSVDHALSTLPTAEPKAWSLVPKTMQEAMEFAKLIAASNLCPPDYRNKPGDVILAVQMGLEIAGCSPLQALQSIAVINGRPCMWGDLVLGVVKQSGLIVMLKERDPQEALAQGEGRCEVLRKGEAEPVVRTFTMAMAETAGLVKRSQSRGGGGPWVTYPGRMLQMRARSLALRDCFPDVLKGLRMREEEEDQQATETAPTVAMPRRASETPAIDDFLAEANEGQVNKSAIQDPEDVLVDAWTGRLTHIETESGTTRGREWTLFKIMTDGGPELGTFSTTLADVARSYIESGEEVTVTWQTTQRGNKNLTGITVPESGDEV